MKPSVLVCIPCLLTGGTEIQTLNLVHALKSADYEVTTLCYFEHTPTIVNAYKDAGSEVICLSDEGTRPVGIWRTISFLYKGLRKVLKAKHYDVVHVQYMAPSAIPIILIHLLGRKTIIATAHTCADIYPNLRLVLFLQRHILRAFTCISLTAEESFFGSVSLFTEKTALAKRNHFTIYNALSPAVPIRQTPRIYSETVTIGVVSRLEHIKGMDLVVPAFQTVYAKHPNTRLLVVGDGSLRKTMEEQAAPLKEAISFVGRQPTDKLCDYYDQIDILWIPSRSEGFGLTALEGMARGCVIVGSKIGGLAELIGKEEEFGMLHSPNDANELADKTNELITSGGLAEVLSTKSIERSTDFTQGLYSNSIARLYHQLTH